MFVWDFAEDVKSAKTHRCGKGICTMKKKFFRKAVCLAAAVILIASSLDAAGSQTKDKIKSTGKKIDELEEQKKDAQEKEIGRAHV